MAKHLRHDFTARAGRHGLFDEVAGFVDGQPVAPEHADVLGLANEMWLMRDDD